MGRTLEGTLWILLIAQLVAIGYRFSVEAPNATMQVAPGPEQTSGMVAAASNGPLNAVPRGGASKWDASASVVAAPDPEAEHVCPEIDIDSLVSLSRGWREWLVQKGAFDVEGKRPGKNPDMPLARLKSLAEAGDPEALYRLGMDEIWRATRVAGDHHPMTWNATFNGERRTPDMVAFEAGVALIERAAALGLDMAYMVLSREFLTLGRDLEARGADAAVLLELDARRYAYGQLPEELYPDLHDNFYESRVFDDKRRMAEAEIDSLLQRRLQVRQDVRLPMDEGVLPDDYYRPRGDDWCLQ